MMARARLSAFLTLGSAVLLAFASSACNRTEAPARHVLLVTIDTTRADRLGSYGRANAGTEWLDGLAARGARVERAYTVAPITLPAHVSLLTGRIPPRTGIHVNGQLGMPAEVTSVADVLGRAGYFTAAAVGGHPLVKATPASRGFMAYDDAFEDRRNAMALERDAGLVVDAAMRLVGRRQGKPLFLWVHFFDPHDPYEPPPPFRERFASDPYQGEIARVDAALADLERRLRAQLGEEELLVVVAADHGESLGEHGEDTHGFFVYEAAVRVPLIFAGPRVPEGAVIEGPVSLVDVAPTLYALLDVAPPSGMDGGIIDFSAPASSTGTAYIESELPLRNYGWSELTGVVAGAEKYIHAPRAEFYDLDRDPGETSNLLPGAAARAGALREQRDAFVADRVEGGAAAADPALASLGYVQFSGASSEGASRPDPKDKIETYQRFQRASRALEQGRPDEALPLLDALLAAERTDGLAFKRVQALRMLGRVDEASSLVETLPTAFAGVAMERARIAVVQQRWNVAREALDQHLATSPRDAEALMLRGAAREFTGDARGAEDDYRASLGANPGFAGASLRLAALYAQTGRIADAIGVLETHLARHPGDELAAGLLRALREAGAGR